MRPSSGRPALTGRAGSTGPERPAQVWSPFLEDDRGGVRVGRRWRLFAGVWLVFLVNPLAAVVDRTEGWRTVAGVAALVAFAGMYLVLLPHGFRVQHRVLALVTPWALFALALAVLPLGGEAGIGCFVFVAVAFLAAYPRSVSFPMLAVIVGLAWWLPYGVDGWSRDGGQQAFAIVLAAAVVLSMIQLLRSNRALLEAREELAELAVVEERERFARDLHDILGHSLTVITKKAELAHRLTAVDPRRAAAEIADVERLAREALTDVRSTVTGYREVSLTGELAAARAALAAAGVAADLPCSVDEVPREYRPLFGWVVREGVTNVLRHSRATTCRIVVSDRSVEVADDGARGDGGDGAAAVSMGNGLRGLRERVAGAGGELVARAPEGGGFVLAACMPPAPAGPAGVAAEPV